MSKVIRLSDKHIRLIEDYRHYKLRVLKDLIDDGFTVCCADYDRIENCEYSELLEDILFDSILSLKEININNNY